MSYPTHRRRPGGIATLVLAGVAALAAGRARAEEPNHFTHGPILGRLSDSGVGVWGRLARAGSFVVRYGTSAARFDRASAEARAEPAHDNTAWVLLDGLEPDTEYFYELAHVDLPGRTGRGGSFRTLPRAQDFAHPELNPRGLFNFSFEVACGNNQNLGQSSGPALPTFRTMLPALKDRIHFAILNGDWLYEARREFTPAQWQAQTSTPDTQVPQVLRVAPTLAGVWENYKHYLSQGEPLARWHRHIASFFTYDDHEALNDIWGAGSPGLRDRRAVFRDIGVRAWYDYLGWSNPNPHTQPIRFGRARLEEGSNVLHDPEADFSALDLAQMTNLHVHWGTPTAGVNDNSLDGVGGDPNAGVYRIVEKLDATRLRIEPAARRNGEASYSIGRRSWFHMRVANCDFFFLDTRGQRQMHDTRDPYKRGLSILGDAQREWLEEGVRASTADFVFVVSSVNLTIPHVGGGAVRAENKDDAWTVFFDERERLIDLWDSLERPVLVLTGDLHNSFAIRITDNVWEFGAGPHNSDNHVASDEGDRPANGTFQYGPRPVEIRWSTWFRSDIPRDELRYPTYCVVQVNNVLNNPLEVGGERWVAFPRPQVVIQYYDGKTGRLRYAESILAAARAE